MSEMDAALAALNERLVAKDEDGRVVLRLVLLATVYFEEAHTGRVREAVIDYCEEYFRRWGAHLRWALNPDTEFMEPFGTGKGSNPRSWLPARAEDENFSLIYHDAENDRGAGALSLEVLGMDRRPYTQLGYLRITFPVFWFTEHPGSLVDVLLDLCRELKPWSGYGGIGVAESPDTSISSSYEPVVYQLAQRFPGLEVDHPTAHSIWLADGDGSIKGVNWLTALGDRFLAKLGGADALEAELTAMDPRFIVHRFDGGVVIQAGPRPQLGDAERDVWPELYVKLAKRLKPIRVSEHGLMQHAGRGLRFDNSERSEAWLRRFDDR